MAEISKIALPGGGTYDIKDATARNSINSLQNTLASGIMYRGVTTTPLTDGATTSPISMGTTNGGSSVQYTPKTGDLVIYGNKEFIFAQVGDTSSWHEFGSTGSLKALAFKDNASGSYTPAGAVGQPTFTGNQGSVNVSGAVNAKVDINMGSAAPKTSLFENRKAGYAHTNEVTPQAVAEGAAVALNTASVKQITGVGTLPALTTTVSGEILTLGWSAGSLPTAAEVTVATSVKSVTQPTVTVGKIFYDYSDATGTVASTGTFTPSGSVSKPSFTGAAATITVK